MDSALVHKLKSLKRRDLMRALDLRPRDLRQHLQMAGPMVSFILRDERPLSVEEREALLALIGERLASLFG